MPGLLGTFRSVSSLGKAGYPVEGLAEFTALPRPLAGFEGAASRQGGEGKGRGMGRDGKTKVGKREKGNGGGKGKGKMGGTGHGMGKGKEGE